MTCKYLKFTSFCFRAVTSGAFCCDVVLDPQLDSWTPSEVGFLCVFTCTTQQKTFSRRQ